MKIPDQNQLGKHYLYGSLITGLLQIVDGLGFYLGIAGELNIAYSYLQMLWFAISIIAAILFVDSLVHKRIAFLYVGYVSLNIILAMTVFEQNDSIYGYVIPGWFSAFSSTTGLLICLLCIRGLRSPRLSSH